MRKLIVVAVLVTLVPTARADHDMAGMTANSSTTPSEFEAGVSLVAASYTQTMFGGDYQGVLPSVSWMRGRWMATASLGLYRIFENGNQTYGPGDLMFGGSVTLFTGEQLRAGLAMMASAPTGNMEQGYGMGGPMVMPQVWTIYTRRRLTMAGSAGWGGMLSGGMMGHEGAIVAPMNQSELEWSEAASLALSDGMRGGVRIFGGIPVGEPGQERLVGALRLAWGQGRVETGAELQAGLVGDPFKVRGVVETALHF